MDGVKPRLDLILWSYACLYKFYFYYYYYYYFSKFLFSPNPLFTLHILLRGKKGGQSGYGIGMTAPDRRWIVSEGEKKKKECDEVLWLWVIRRPFSLHLTFISIQIYLNLLCHYY
jgi:hypothetical protein